MARPTDTMRCSGRTALQLCCAAALLLAVPGPIDARTRRPRAKKVALFVWTRGDPDPAVLQAVRDGIAQSAALTPGIDLLPDARLRKKLGAGDPADAVARCGADLGCIAKIGRRVGAQWVLYGRVTGSGDAGEVKAGFLLVGVKSRKVENKVGLSLANAEEARAAMVSEGFALLGVKDLGMLALPEGTGAVKVDGVALGSGPGPFTLPAGVHSLEAADRVLQVEVVAKKTIEVATGRPVALLLVSKGTPSWHADQVRGTLEEQFRLSREIAILSPGDLRRGIGKPPAALLDRCGANIGCIAGLGRQAGAQTVLYGRIVPGKAGAGAVRFQVLRIDVATAGIEGKHNLSAGGETKLAAVVETRAREILGLSAAPPPAETPPVTVAKTTPPPPVSEPAAEVPPVSAPDPAPTETIVALAVPDTPPGTSPVAPPPAPEPPSSSALLTYTGLVVGGLGLATLGGGGYFALSTNSSNRSLRAIEAGTQSATQVEASQLMSDAQTSATRANLLMAAGGGALALGTVLLGLDLLGDAPAADVSAAALPTPGGAAVVVQVSW